MRRCIGVFIICYLAMTGLSSRLMAEPTNKIVAVVNSDVITEEELDIFMKVARMEADNSLSGSPKEQRRYFLDRLIEDKLLLQEAVRQGLRVDDAAINDRIKEMKLRAGSERAFDQALKSEAISLNDLRQKLREQFLVYEIIQGQIKSKVQVSPKEISDYFESHRDAYQLPETAVVDSIFVENQDQAEQVKAALAQGQDFLKVANEFSKKSNIGSVRRGMFKKDLEDLIFGLKPGQVSEAFGVEGGFYIFLLRETMPATRQSIGDVKDTIKGQLEAEKMHKAMREFIESLKDKAYISLRDT